MRRFDHLEKDTDLRIGRRLEAVRRSESRIYIIISSFSELFNFCLKTLCSRKVRGLVLFPLYNMLH